MVKKSLFNRTLCVLFILLLVKHSDAWRRRRRRRAPPPPPPPDTTPPSFTYCPGNIGSQYTTSTTKAVSWSTPTATDNRGSVSVSRTSGSASGSTFSEGSHSVVYTATDSAGNQATCAVSFSVVVIRCSTLPAPSHGSVSCTNTVYVGSHCTYSCLTGYRHSSGSTSRTCSQSGNSASWSGTAAQCARITCSGLSNPSNGRVTCTDGSYYNSQCTFSCSGGYTLQGGTTRVCSSSGSWSGSSPTCADTTDPSFTSCPSSQMVYAPNLATTATVSWSVPVASDSSGGSVTVSRTQGADTGSSFAEGVHPISYTARDAARNTATCSFSVTVRVIRCAALSAAAPLQVTCPHGNIRGSTCTYSCQLGHSLQGQGSTECQQSGSSGAWSSGPPSCQVLHCPSHAAPAHGSIVGSCSTAYGSTCYFACDSGYEINSNNPRECAVGAQSGTAFWEGPVPVCTRIQCRKPSLTTALQISTSQACPSGDYVPSGNQCLFSCAAGYYLVGNAALTCQNDRSWSHETPTCHQITCAGSALPAPAHGEKRGCPGARESYGAVCTLACNVGYLPSTTVRRTCTDDGDGDGDGVWAGDDLSCSIVMCSELAAPPNGQITACTYQGGVQSVVGRQRYSTTCSLGCGVGFTRTGGSSTRVCQASGDWDGNQAVCEDTTPPVLTCPADKTLVAGALATSASVPWSEWEPLVGTDRGSPLPAALFSIDSSEVGAEGPQSLAEGPHQIVYRATDLAGNEASCSFSVLVQVTRCPPLLVPDHASAALDVGEGRCQEGALFGDSCRITCDSGYRLSSDTDSLTRACQRASDTATAGHWSGQHEICNVKNCTVPAVTNGFVGDCSTPMVSYQTSCQFRCSPGYMAPSSVEAVERTCQEDESWSGVALQCTVAKTCPALLSVAHGSVAPASCESDATVRFATVCEFSCGAGYLLEGPPTLSCSTEGEWNTNERPSCHDVQPPSFTLPCPRSVTTDAQRGTLATPVMFEEPVATDNSGQVNVTRMDGTKGPGEIFDEGDTTVGYIATDSTGLTTRCDVVITVQVHRCPPQQPLPHGSVDGCQDSYYGSQCNFSCDVGYDLIGAGLVSCDLPPDGQPVWSHDSPACQIRTCPPLAVQAPATLSGCGQSAPAPYGSVCTFHCPVGYQGVGQSEKRCQADRSWSSSDFVCQRKSCPPLEEASGIRITPASCLDDPRYEDRCGLECRTLGYRIDPSALGATTCSAQQTWTQDIGEARCIDIEAPTFDLCPSDILAYAERGSDRADIQWEVLASDNSGSDPAVTCNPRPGVMTSGSYSVTCMGRDEAGNEVTCRFDVEVIVRECSGVLVPPLFGTLVGSCDVSYGSVCQVTCLVGYSLVGSPEASCEFNGTDMYWQTDDQPYCQVIGCDPLVVHSSVTVSPASCTLAERVHAGTVCSVHCEREGSLSSPAEAMICLEGGSWSTNETEAAALRCLDYRGPVISSCPSQPIVATRTEFWGVEVTFDLPTAIDNWDDELHVETTPPDLASPYNFTSDTTCSFTFTDRSNNSAVCVFQVLITNEVRPVVQFCPPSQNITTSSKLTEVGWEEPTFLAAPGTQTVQTSNRGDNPTFLPWGSHVILYRFRDQENGLAAECRIIITIIPVPCVDLHTPGHGALACDDGFAYGRYCTMLCSEGYDVPRLTYKQRPQELFICGTSGLWYPHSNVPDCSIPRNPRRMNLPLSIMYYKGECATPEGNATQLVISQKFIDIVNGSHFYEICTKNVECTVENVHVTCGVANTRRKRDLDAFGTGENVTVVSMVLHMAPFAADFEGSQSMHQELVDLALHVHQHAHIIMPSGGSSGIKDSASSGGSGGIKDSTSSGGSGGIMEDTHGPAALDPALLYNDIRVECDEGYVLASSSHLCVACPPGFFHDESSLECTPCERGTYQDEPAQARCKPCANGTYTRERGAREKQDCEVECAPGQFSASGFTPCLPCMVGQFQPLHGQSECYGCPDGLTTTEGATSILDCREPCPSGFFSSSGLQPCQPCPPGTYQPHPQQTHCRPCGRSAPPSVQGGGATSVGDC